MNLVNPSNQFPADLSLIDFAKYLADSKSENFFSIEDAIRIWERAKGKTNNNSLLKQILHAYQFTDTARAWLIEQQQKHSIALPLILNQLIKEYKLPSSLNFKIEEKEVIQQQTTYPSQVTFKEALQAAVSCFLYDYNIDESPGFIITQLNSAYTTTTEAGKAAIYTRIKELLTTAELELIPDFNWHHRNFVYFEPPFYGESVADHWIFSLRLFDLSQHVYWAIIPRDGQKQAYCYGFS